MENEQLLSFGTRYILPYGRGISIITAWEEGHDFHCERFVVFEKTDGTCIRRGLSTRIRKIDFIGHPTFKSELEKLMQFMDHEGRVLAEADVYSIIVELMQSMERFPDGRVANVTLHPSNYITDLMYLQKRFPTELTWINDNTRSTMLKAMVQVVSRIRTDESNF